MQQTLRDLCSFTVVVMIVVVVVVIIQIIIIIIVVVVVIVIVMLYMLLHFMERGSVKEGQQRYSHSSTITDDNTRKHTRKSTFWFRRGGRESCRECIILSIILP